MSQEPNFLYNFLPAVYRTQDQQQGLPLQALFSIMQEEFENIQRQIDTAYANCFIETCETWVEAYIADLLGVQGLDSSDALPTQRARIANTIGYRRRKGQQGVLERVINDVTGWRADVVEYAQLLGMTQHTQHVRPGKGQMMNIRNIYGVDTLKTPFEVNAHLVDIRSPLRYPTKFNINNLGLFIWRLVSYPVIHGFAKEIKVEDVSKGYTFSPIGRDTQLFNPPQPLTDLNQRATETSLPIAIRAAAFAQDLANNADPQNSTYYGEDHNFYITVVKKGNEGGQDIKADKIVAADLSNWSPPPLLSDQAAVDVTLGRFILGSGYTNIDHVEANYNYGFSAAQIAGGHYNRQQTLNAVDENTIYVPSPPESLVDAISQPTLTAAIELWESNSKYTTIQIMDDATYAIDILSISNDTSSPRTCIIQAANNTRPCLQIPTIQLSANNTLSVTFNGLLIDGSLDLQENVHLIISHCTLVPVTDVPKADTPVISISSAGANGSTVTIDHSITGALHLPENIISLEVSDSIIDAQNGVALAGAADTTVTPNVPTKPGPNAKLERVTIFGSVYVAELVLLSESIVTGTVITDRTQTGTVRFSYLPLDSKTPPRFKCQPNLDVTSQVGLQPRFTSTRYNDPGYAQLDVNFQQCIARGAANGSEMGCFQSLNQPQRQEQLQVILDEYLPFGLTTNIFYVT